MPTLEDVYLKFGFASEAAQLLETELGNMLLMAGCIEHGQFDGSGSLRAMKLLNHVNRQTLGQLVKSLQQADTRVDELDTKLRRALRERNRLSHSFYRQHNFRRNSQEGRVEMMRDLDVIHDAILDAYKDLLLLSGIDLDAISSEVLPTEHVTL